jgi:hypothetical protein
MGRTVRWRGEIRNAYRMLVGIVEGSRLLETHRRVEEGNIKMELTRKEWRCRPLY